MNFNGKRATPLYISTRIKIIKKKCRSEKETGSNFEQIKCNGTCSSVLVDSLMVAIIRMQEQNPIFIVGFSTLPLYNSEKIKKIVEKREERSTLSFWRSLFFL